MQILKSIKSTIERGYILLCLFSEEFSLHMWNIFLDSRHDY